MEAPERSPLLSDETLIHMESAPMPSIYRAEDLFTGNARRLYLSYSESSATTIFVEEMAKRSGLEAVYRALAADPAAVEALAEEAASYAVSPVVKGRGIQLIEQGMDLSSRGGELSLSIRRQSERGEISRERVRHRAIPISSESHGPSFKIFAANAIHNLVDPRNGRMRRDGDMASSGKAKKNHVHGRPEWQRPNYSQFLSRAAHQVSRDDKRWEGADPSPQRAKFVAETASLRALLLAGDELTAKIESRALAIAADRQERWMEQAGFGPAYQTARRVWGASASLSDIEMAQAHLSTIQSVLEKGNLGLFSLRMARGFGLDGIPEDVTGQVKAHMSRLGLSDAGWRRVNKMEPEALLPMASRFSRPTDARGNRNYDERSESPIRGFAQALAVSLANNVPADVTEALAAKAGSRETQDRAFAQAFCSLCEPSLGKMEITSIEQARHYIAESEAKAERLPHVIKAFSLRAAQAGAQAACDELELLRDYIRSSEMGVWQQMPAAPNWGQLMRAQRDWHELVERKQNGSALEWVSHLPESVSEESGYEAKALVSGYELLLEGKAMHHCVSSYAKACHDKGTRIFSITRDGARFGTLELTPDAKDPTLHAVGQFKGLCNAAIEPPDAWAFASQIASLYTEAARRAAAQAKAEQASAPKP